MKVFMGCYALKKCLDDKMPISIFYRWAWEKFKADMVIALWFILLSPYVAWGLIAFCIQLTGKVLELIGSGMFRLKDIMPEKLFMPSTLRDKQIKIVDEYNALKAERNGKAE